MHMRIVGTGSPDTCAMQFREYLVSTAHARAQSHLTELARGSGSGLKRPILRRMSLAIATPSQVLVSCCNYHDLQWSEAKICWVQLVMKSGDYILKIGRREDGRVSRAHSIVK